VHVDEKVRRYLMQIVHATRENEELSLGASPRASLSLFRASQAMAAIFGRNFVQPDDVTPASNMGQLSTAPIDVTSGLMTLAVLALFGSFFAG
jgi:hypothetical protein